MIIIIDYGLGNLGSVQNALSKLGVPCMVSSAASDIANADGLILPGVGAAGEGMKNLKEKKLDQLITEEVLKGKPILGICLGMQLFMTQSEEGDVKCLNLIEGDVKQFTVQLKVPQIGWNTVMSMENIKLFKNILKSSYFYFVHSYYCVPNDKKNIVGATKYEVPFCSGVQKANIFGVQFHPEKSGENGLQLLKNFSDIVNENNTSG
jgi:imidazole glycerol-phosphate synthase subunit HisH